MNSAFQRVSAFSARLCFRGLLENCTIGALKRSGRGYRLSLRWTLPDAEGEGEWITEVIVLLPDAESEEQWLRRLSLALSDATGHELGEAVTLDGVPLASPRLRPMAWLWRPQDNSEA